MRIYVTTVNIEISCHMIIDLKERVARPASSFPSVLLKSDLHFAAKVRKRFCFQRQKATEGERKSDGECVLLFIRFVSFFRFQVGGDDSSCFALRQSCAKREYGDFDGLWEVYGTVARAIVASHVYSKIASSMKKSRNHEDLRNTPHLILRA